MPITREERLARKMQHTKQERTQISQGVPSVSDLRDGVSVIRSTPEGLIEYVRHKNALYRKALDRADIAKTRTTTLTKQDLTLPIFQAHRSGSDQTNLNADTEHTIAFNAKSVDTVSGFNTSTYKYTISVSGIYFLYYNVTFTDLDSAMTALNVQMKDNDGNYFAIHRMDDKEYTADTGFLTRAAYTMRRLNVGQTVEVIVYISGGHNDTDIKRNISSTTGAETTFGGYLLTPKTFNETTQTTAVAGSDDSGGGLGGGGAIT